MPPDIGMEQFTI